MKTSKKFMLAAIFSFAVAGAWIAGGHSAAAQAGGTKGTTTAPPPPPGNKATTTKTYNSGSSTTGYTHANPPTPGAGGYSIDTKTWEQNPGLQQGGAGGAKSGK
jgi:hypothetical protein